LDFEKATLTESGLPWTRYQPASQVDSLPPLANNGNRSLSAPVSYTFTYIGNGSAFPGNKIVSTSFSEGELETLQRKPLETNVEIFRIFRSQLLVLNKDLQACICRNRCRDSRYQQ